MDLVIIGDSKFKNCFDKVFSKDSYDVAQINDKKCVFINTNHDFLSSLDIVEDIGASKILEVTENEIDSKKIDMAFSMGISYTGFCVKGNCEYVKTLIKGAILESYYKPKSNLTEREKEVLLLVGDGLSNKEIAKKLFLSEKTVKNHLNNIFKKIEVTDRTNAALYVIKNGI